MTTKEKIEVMEAYAEGKKIQFRMSGDKDWWNWTYPGEPNWNWGDCDYRIKPNSMELERNKGCTGGEQMREISTKDLEVGEHVLIDGVEYVAKAEEGAGDCKGCDLGNGKPCFLVPCHNGVIFKRVEKQLQEKEYKVEKQDKDTLMTNLQLAEWLAKGCGQWKHSLSNSGAVYHTYLVIEDKEGCFVEDYVLIRPWGTDEWIKPSLKIYQRDCILKRMGPAIMKEIPEMLNGGINLCGLGGFVQSNT